MIFFFGGGGDLTGADLTGADLLKGQIVYDLQ